MGTSTSRLCRRLFEPFGFDMTRTIWHSSGPRPGARRPIPARVSDSRPGSHARGRSRHRSGRIGQVLVFFCAVLLWFAATEIGAVSNLSEDGLFGASGLAHAGDVEGKVVFKPNKLGKPPVRNKGFLARIENPLRPIRKFNPRPYMFVVLDGQVDDEAKKPPGGKIRYYLQGQSFNRPILPVIVNTRVELVNSTSREATLFTPDSDAIADAHTFNPRGMFDFKVTEAGSVIVIRSQDETHIEGRVVGFPHRYYAPVNSRGKFEIKDVPEGTFKIKVWYRNGWLEGVEASVEVDKRRGGEVDLTIAPDKIRSQK